MYVLPTGPRGIGEVLDSVFKLFGASFGKLLPFSIAAGLIGLLPMGYLFMSGALEPQEAQATPFGVGAGYWIAFALTFPLTIILIGASIARAEALAQGTPMTAGEAAGIAARRVLTLILASICLSLVLIVGFALLVIPGLILMITLYMFVPAIVLDRKGSVESLKYSHGLVWGNWWRTAGIVTIAFIIVYVLYLLMGLVAGLIEHDSTAGDDTARDMDIAVVRFDAPDNWTRRSAPTGSSARPRHRHGGSGYRRPSR